MKFFRRVLFNWLVGNANMHLKNISLIHRDGKVEFSPAYNLLNTVISDDVLNGESALTLRGLKAGFNREILFSYFGEEQLSLNKKVLQKIEYDLKETYPEWKELIKVSFLSRAAKRAYLELIDERKNSLGWE